MYQSYTARFYPLGQPDPENVFCNGLEGLNRRSEINSCRHMFIADYKYCSTLTARILQ
jgi:hypothetical protein